MLGESFDASLPHFIGRDDEIARFRQTLELETGQAISHSGYCGYPGSGKTWLLRKLAQIAQAESIPTFRLDLCVRNCGARVPDEAALCVAMIDTFAIEAPLTLLKVAAVLALEIMEDPNPEEPHAFLDAASGLFESPYLSALYGSAFASSWGVFSRQRETVARYLQSEEGLSEWETLSQGGGQDLRETLLETFASEFRASSNPLRAGRAVQAVVFLDSAEFAFTEGMDEEARTESMAWMSRLADCGAGILVVPFSGLCFPDGQPLQTDLLPFFSEEVAEAYARQRGVPEESIAATVAISTEFAGRPGCHPYCLAVAVDTVLANPDADFASAMSPVKNRPLGLNRLFLASLDAPTAELLRWLAATPVWDEACLTWVGEAAKTSGDLEKIRDYAIVGRTSEGRFNLHQIASLAILDGLSDRQSEAMHAQWQRHWRARSKSPGDFADLITWSHAFEEHLGAAIENWGRASERAQEQDLPFDHAALVACLAVVLDLAKAIPPAILLAASELQNVEVGNQERMAHFAISCNLLGIALLADDPRQEAGKAYARLGQLYMRLTTGDLDGYRSRAIAACKAAMQTYSGDQYPTLNAELWAYVGHAYEAMETGNLEEKIHRAIAAYRSALEVTDPDEYEDNWTTLQQNIMYAEMRLGLVNFQRSGRPEGPEVAPLAEVSWFVGREREQADFRASLALSSKAFIPQGGYFGASGVGKTWLRRRFEEIAREESVPVYSIELNVGELGSWVPDEAGLCVTMIRAFGISAPRTLIAIANLLRMEIGSPRNILESEKRKPEQNRAILDGLRLYFSGFNLDSLYGPVFRGDWSVYADQLDSLAAYMDTEAGGLDYDALEFAEPTELRKELFPRLLQDLQVARPDRSGRAVQGVLLVDAIEQAFPPYPTNEERREILAWLDELPGILVVPFGTDPFPSGLPFTSRELGAFDEAEAKSYARLRGLPEARVGEERDPLTLALAADLHDVAPAAAAPQGFEALLQAFFRAIGEEKTSRIRRLAVTPLWDEEAFARVYGQEHLRERDDAELREVARLSFVDRNPHGNYSVHPRVRHAVLNSLTDGGRRQLETEWRDSWRRRKVETNDFAARNSWRHAFHLSAEATALQWRRKARASLQSGRMLEAADWIGAFIGVMGDLDGYAELAYHWAGEALGLRIGNMDRNLRNVIRAYEISVNNGERIRDEDRAPIQNNLGFAFMGLSTGDIEANQRRALKAFELSAGIYKQLGQKTPWASLQLSLGSAHSEFQGPDRVAHLKQSLVHYIAASEVFSESEFPDQWAEIHRGIARTYTCLASEVRSDYAVLASLAYDVALKSMRREDNPQAYFEATFFAAVVLSRHGYIEEAKPYARRARLLAEQEGKEFLLPSIDVMIEGVG